MTDSIQRFLFENTDIRGAIIRLDDSFEKLITAANYSAEQQALLAEFAIASVLLASQLKFSGRVSLQARSGDGLLIVAECQDQKFYRAVIEGESNHWDFATIFASNAVLALTLEPENGQRYQGIVPLEKPTLTGCLEDYFMQSEQLPSWFQFAKLGHKVAAVMLQALPMQICQSQAQRDEDWQRVKHLAETLSNEEMLVLPFNEILYRLYHEENVRVFDEQPVGFRCSCSQEKMERALLNLGEQELLEIIKEQGAIDTQCHFCHRSYHFEQSEIQLLLRGGNSGH